MKKTLKIFLSMILALCIMVPVMAANENVTSSLSASKNEVKKGEELTVTLQINNLPTSNTKALEGKIGFDSSKLELQNNENLNSWITTLSTDGTGMASYKTGSSTANEQTLNLTFKVKDNAEVGDTTISVSNMQLALEEGNGEAGSEIDVAGSSVKISIVKAESPSQDPTEDPTQGNNSSGNIKNQAENIKNNNDNTISNNSQHAKAGDIQTIALVLTIAVLIITSAIVYFKYKKLDI